MGRALMIGTVVGLLLLVLGLLWAPATAGKPADTQAVSAPEVVAFITGDQAQALPADLTPAALDLVRSSCVPSQNSRVHLTTPCWSRDRTDGIALTLAVRRSIRDSSPRVVPLLMM